MRRRLRDDAPMDHAAFPAAPLLVFSDDWGRHPSSSQHLIGRLAGRRRVVWVNTVGTRPPRLDGYTARRALGKLRQWSVWRGERPDRRAAPNPLVLSPKMWPSFGSPWARRLNRRLLAAGLRATLDALPRPPVAVTTLPLVADLVGELPVERWVYYCVDDFSVWPGYDGDTLRSLEAELAGKVDAAIAVSDTLVEHLARLGRPAHLLTHGVDLEHWARAQGQGAADVPEEFAGLPPPYVVFWGSIDRRMDTGFVRALADRLRSGTVVLIGPQDHPDPVLLALPKVAVLPAVAFPRLPRIAAAASVLVMPYADLPVTRAMQPLKLKEYLATGRPAVVRGLPSTRPWADACDVCDTAGEFAAAVERRIEAGLPAAQRDARRRLADEGWSAKARQFERWIDGEPSQDRPGPADRPQPAADAAAPAR